MTITKSTSQPNQTLSAFLDSIAESYSSRPALLYKPSLRTKTWTYEHLRATADRIAHWLQNQGVGKGDRVALWAPNSPWWVASFFGILRNGSVVVPLDARSSADFVERVISQSEPKLAMVASRMVKDWVYEVPAFSVEELDGLLPADPSENPPTILGTDLAEIVYTSGTTGAPKGVMLSHSNIRFNVEAINQVFPSGPRFRPLSILPLSHLLEQTCGLLLALRGGTAIAYATALQPAAIQRDMAEYRVTTMVLVPRILSVFMDSIERGVKREGKERSWTLACRISAYLPLWARRILFRSVIRRFGGRLNFLVTGGAALEPELERKWELLGIPILQGYGATETSPIITGTALNDRKPRSVGKALPDTVVKLTREGEIVVTGPNVMQGYWKNPEATAEVLKDGWYSTGDLGEFDAEGRLYLRGRKKDMIVLANGLNVFPEDVEETLRRAAGVVEAVVMAVPSSFGPQVHAVLVCRGGNADGGVIVQEANAKLAPHQQVRSWEIWHGPDFPRTHTLKIKRKEVAKFVLSEQKGEKVAAPQATLQSSEKPKLAQILASVVGKPVAEVTADSNLIDLGVDLAKRIQLGRAVEDGLGKFVDDSRVGPETTVAQLEQLLSAENPSGEELYPLWPFSHRIRFIRTLLQLPIFTAESFLVRPTTIGAEQLRELKPPMIFVMGYQSLLDAPFALGAMPRRIRERVGISTSWKTDRRSRWIAAAVAFFFNSFRYSQRGSAHASLVHASGLLDHEWSILFMLRRGGQDAGGEALNAGISLLAAEFGVPLVPVQISGLNRKPPLWLVPRRHTVTVTFGMPIGGEPDLTYQQVEDLLKPGVDGSPESIGECEKVG